MDRFKALAATADEGAVLRCAVEVANDAFVVATNSAWGKSRDLDCLEKVVWILSSAHSGTEIPPEYAESTYIDAAALAVQASRWGRRQRERPLVLLRSSLVSQPTPRATVQSTTLRPT